MHWILCTPSPSCAAGCALLSINPELISTFLFCTVFQVLAAVDLAIVSNETPFPAVSTPFPLTLRLSAVNS